MVLIQTAVALLQNQWNFKALTDCVNWASYFVGELKLGGVALFSVSTSCHSVKKVCWVTPITGNGLRCTAYTPKSSEACWRRHCNCLTRSSTVKVQWFWQVGLLALSSSFDCCQAMLVIMFTWLIIHWNLCSPRRWCSTQAFSRCHSLHFVKAGAGLSRSNSSRLH